MTPEVREMQILGANDTSDKVETLGSEIFSVAYDKDTIHTEFDVVAASKRSNGVPRPKS